MGRKWGTRMGKQYDAFRDAYEAGKEWHAHVLRVNCACTAERSRCREGTKLRRRFLLLRDACEKILRDEMRGISKSRNHRLGEK